MSWLKGRSKGTYASLRTQKPMARSEDLVIEKVEDEVLVYDAKNHQAHCLASAAAKVWRACDGTKDVPALAESLALSVDDVTRALEMLDGVELLENQGLQIVSNGNGNGLTRRDFGLKSGKVGAAVADSLLGRRTLSGGRGDADEPPVRALLHGLLRLNYGRRVYLGVLLLLSKDALQGRRLDQHVQPAGRVSRSYREAGLLQLLLEQLLAH